MKRTLAQRILILALTACACLFGQTSLEVPDSIRPNNSWPVDPQGFRFYPDDVAGQYYCTYELRNGFKVLIGGIPFALTVQTTQEAGTVKTGGHVHEMYTGGQPSRPRPVAKILLTAGGLTNNPFGIGGSNTYFGVTEASGIDYGCKKFYLQLPGVSGMYTLKVQAPVTLNPITGVNYFATYQVPNPNTHLSDWLVPYPDDQTKNSPQDFPLPDSDRHVGGPLFLDPHRVATFQRFGVNFMAASVARTGNIIKQIKNTRCSTEYGGVSDNDRAGLAPYVAASFEWDTRMTESHAFGEECDAVNPSLNEPQPQASQFIQALRDAFVAGGCVLGALSPDGVYIGSSMDAVIGYWGSSDKFHYSCGSRPAPVSGRGSGVGGK